MGAALPDQKITSKVPKAPNGGQEEEIMEPRPAEQGNTSKESNDKQDEENIGPQSAGPAKRRGAPVDDLERGPDA